jgi:RNA polymerase sigma-70 factor (ECF subfamily)
VTESEQVARAQQGDAAAWGDLVRHHQTAIFRLAYLLLGNADDAEDVAQETFIRAYRALPSFDRARPLGPWLLEIARNSCYNWRRALRRCWATLQRWGKVTHDQRVDPIHTEPDTHVARQWQAVTLWQAVQRLPRIDQEVIYLRCFLDLSVEETAQTLQVAPGTVKSRLARATERLRHVVEAEFPHLHEEIAE